MTKAVSGVYVIINTINGHRYIGSSQDIPNRWVRHLKRLELKSHHSRHLQNAWNKYGAQSFKFVILRECLTSELLEIEQRYLDESLPEYNVSPTAGRTSGIVRSEEYRRKQSISQKGKIVSQEVREKISKGMKGKRNSAGVKRVNSTETKSKISATLTGHRVSEETKDKIRKSRGEYRHTDEAKKRIGEAAKGNRYASRRHTEADKSRQRQKMLDYWKRKKQEQSNQDDQRRD